MREDEPGPPLLYPRYCGVARYGEIITIFLGEGEYDLEANDALQLASDLTWHANAIKNEMGSKNE